MRESVLAGATLAATFLLLVAGGLVHATGSALACPDWPLCYGNAFPTMTGGVFYEHGHRLTAGTVALLTLFLTLKLLGRWQGRGKTLGRTALALLLLQAACLARAGMLASAGKTLFDGPATWLGLAVLAAVAVVGLAVFLARSESDPLPAVGLAGSQIVQFQAGLGGLTVLMRLPTVVSTAHLATAMIFTALLVYLLFRLLGFRAHGGSSPRLSVALVVTYAQLLWGAVVRHTGSALACNVDLVTCDGGLPLNGAALLNYGHRLFGIVTAGVLFWACLPLLRQRSNEPVAARLAGLTLALVVIQIVLGLATVGSFIAVPWATAHLANGALTFAAIVATRIAATSKAPDRQTTFVSTAEPLGVS